MTNETAPHDNSVADDPAATIAASIVDTGTSPVVTEDIISSEAAGLPLEPAEPKLPSFDDLGLHPDVKLALDDMGYFAPTPVQTAVYKPVSEG